MNAVIGALFVIAIIFGVKILREKLKSPFVYPYFVHDFDVTGKRNPQIGDLLDEYLNSGGFDEIQAHQKKIEAWHEESKARIERSLLKDYRRKQYLMAVDDRKAYKFNLIRVQTRYRQKNYVKTPYTVNMNVGAFGCYYGYLMQRHEELAWIGFECTLRQYNSKNQRKLATRELRESIMKRDNYTCQICGKHMPDEVGLQIDHIIPVARGGKTVPSNLRVLCSKCNGAKSDKIES